MQAVKFGLDLSKTSGFFISKIKEIFKWREGEQRQRGTKTRACQEEQGVRFGRRICRVGDTCDRPGVGGFGVQATKVKLVDDRWSRRGS